MKKTPKMLEVEERIGEPIDVYLRREYVDEGMNAREIGEKFGVSEAPVLRWLRKYGIPVRTSAESRLWSHIDHNKIAKDELVRLHIQERKSILQMSKLLGIARETIKDILTQHNIPIRDSRRKGQIKKEELEELYRTKTMEEIAHFYEVSGTHVRNKLNQYGIPIKTLSEARLTKSGGHIPSENELRKLYAQHKSAKKIADLYKVSEPTILTYLHKYQIIKSINTNKQFINLIRRDKVAGNLVVMATLLNGEASNIEQLITEIYNGQFTNQQQLHALIDENRKEVYELVEAGLTNLGAYIGNFSLDDRVIIPVLIGQAISSIPDEKLTSSLEKRVINILRTQYSPLFNENMQGTLKTIEGKLEESDGKIRGIYQKLYDHYQEVMQLQEELA